MITPALVISSLGLLAFVGATVAWFRRIQRVAIPDNRFAFLGVWLLAVVLGVAGFYSAGGSWISGIFGGIAIFGGGTFLTLYALGGQRASDPIAVGDAMPVFSAVDSDRVTFDSTSLSGAPVLLKFFRGHW
jgi:hypothetical protein